MKVTVTPAFKSKEIVNSTLASSWPEFQSGGMDIGEKLLDYMRNYINSNTKRQGATGNLANHIDITKEAGAGLGKVFWGIGDIDVLNSFAKYWYVLNYGVYIGSQEPFIPGKPKGASIRQVPGYFGSGNAPDSSLKGIGGESFTYSKNNFVITPGVIRPINYIQSTIRQYDIEIDKLIKEFGK